ncbi:MAG: ABC transporter ATP-binding protein [Candidatus Azosocius agrarius]|nr:MAG: ABC transporter ATP-binding protein [Gammaproteobacteria bacterium]
MISNSLFLNNLNFSYKVNKNILDNLNITFQSGKITALLGINGSGKTTLLKILCGIIRHYSGTIVFNNNIINDSNFIEYKKLVGYMPELLQLYSNMTVIEVLEYLSILKNKFISFNVVDILIKVGLEEHYKKKVKELSKGMKQKLNLAQAIVNNPKIVLFDEPSNGFDCNSILMFYRILRQLSDNGSIVILSTHHVNEIYSNVDNVVVLSHGKISKEFNINELFNNCKNKLYVYFYFYNMNYEFFNYINLNYSFLKFNDNMLIGEFSMIDLINIFFYIKEYKIVVNNIRTEDKEFSIYLMNLL